MKNRIILTAALVFLALFSLAFARQASRPQQWEYKIEQGLMSEKKLNDLAAQGWEVVAVGPTGATITIPFFVLKRPK